MRKQDSADSACPPSPTGKLFGVPLDALTESQPMPKPILVSALVFVGLEVGYWPVCFEFTKTAIFICRSFLGSDGPLGDRGRVYGRHFSKATEK